MRHLTAGLFLAFLLQLFANPLFGGYAANPSFTSSGTDSSGASSSSLRLEITSIGATSNDVTFRVTKKDGTTFSTAGTLSIRVDCGGTSCSVVSSTSVAIGTTSKSFTVFMPTYVQGTVIKNFYSRYEAATGYWTYAGPIAISAPSLATPTFTSTSEIGMTSARLNWGPVTAAESYRYQVTSGTSFTTSGDGSVCSNCIANSTTTGITKIVTGLASGTTYRWRVRAGNATTGQGSLWSTTLAFSTMAPTVSSVTPTSAVLGQTTTFTVAGNNLTAGMGFWIDTCVGIEEVSGGSSSSRQFRCTPSFTTGIKNGEVKTAPGGTLLRAFTVSVTGLPTVGSVTPTSTFLGQATTFTVTGSSLTAGLGFWIDACAGITEISGGSASSRQFQCTPVTTGIKAGEVKTVPGGTLLHTFSVNIFPLPTVTEVKPINAIFGESTTFTIFGSGLRAEMGFWVHDCAGITEVSGGTATERQFRCTPSSTTGAKAGEVKTVAQGTLLHSFSVNVIVRPTNISVSPLQATLGVPLTFTIDGTGLPTGLGFWVDDCAGVAEVAGGTSTRRQFTCTPGDNCGAKNGEIKVASEGTLLHTFSVNVLPLPTVIEVKPVNAILGEPTTFSISGSGLISGMGFWVHECAGIAELSGGSGERRFFRCTPGGTTGTKAGEVKTVPQGTLLHSFSVNVIVRPANISVSPLQASLGVPLTFTIDGTGLPGGMGFWVDDCAGVTEVAGGTSSRRQFRCTPGENIGVKSGEVKTAFEGTLLLTFSVNVVASSPTVAAVAPLTATTGQTTTFIVSGANLTGGIGFWIDGCSGVTEVSGGSALSRQFRCTPSVAGQKAGEVKDAPGGTLLHQFSVAVAGNGIYLNVDPWAQAAAEFLVQQGIVVDPPNHDLRGTSDIRRAELATMLYRALGGGLAQADARFSTWHGALLRSPFVDVSDPTVWYFLPAAYLGNLTFGDEISVFDRWQSVFRSDGIISRGWAVKAILEAWNISPLTTLQGVTLFADVPASHPAAGYIYRAVEKGIATGTAGVFSPDVAADRQDLFVLLHRLMDASANALSLAVPSPAPLTPADFDDAQAFARRSLGSRYEQPVLMGVQPPTASISVVRSGLETVGTLQGIYTVTLGATISGIDSRAFTDSHGNSYQANPFCSWDAASGGLVDETPAGGIPFSRVKWIAPADSSPASGASLAVGVTLRVGDGLGSEVTAVRTLLLTGRPTPDPNLPLLTIDPVAAVRAGELVEVTGRVNDSGNSESSAFGDLEVYLSFSRDGGASWTPVGQAALRANSQWDAFWRVPEPAGTAILRALAVNIRGNQREARTGITIGARLTIQGIVVNTSFQPLPGTRVTLSEGGIDLASVLTDAQGGFLFTTGGVGDLGMGRSYTLTAAAGTLRATTSSVVLNSTAPRAERTLVIGIDSTPPITEASMPSGTFSAPFTVALTCQDDSSGCATIHYTTNGSTPTIASSTYSTPIPVTANLSLRFFAVDTRGNQEAPRRRTYSFRACSFEVSSASATFPQVGGIGQVTVQTGNDCTWRLESIVPWITVTESGNFQGPSAAGFTVAANSGEAPRSGSLTVAGRAVSIVQAGAISYTLTVVKGGSGSGSVVSSPTGIGCGGVCSASFPEGAQVALGGVPTTGSTFAVWSGDADCLDGTVTMNIARSCIAIFTLDQVQTFPLTVQPAGLGSGLVSSSPTGISCPPDCTESYPAGTAVSLSAEPDPMSVFSGWSGSGCTGTGSCSLTLHAPLGVTATFGRAGTTQCSQGWAVQGPQYGNIQEIAIDPTLPFHLFATTAGGVFESLDGGESWNLAGLGGVATRDLLIDPAEPSRVYVAGLSEFFSSVDGGATWHTLRNGLGSGLATALEIAPSDPATLFSGVYPLGIFRSHDHGASWSLVHSDSNTQVVVLRVDPSNASTIFAGANGDVLVSRDGGNSWSPSLSGATWVHDILVDRGSSNNVLVAGFDRLFQSSDGGRTWTAIKNGYFQDFAQVPGETARIFLSDRLGGVWSSIDGGRTWAQLSVLSEVSINTLTVGVSTNPHLYLATVRGIRKSVDGGWTWRENNAGLTALRVATLAQAPDTPSTLWAGNKEGGGIFQTTDAGLQWMPQGLEPLRVSVSDMVAVSRSIVYVSAHPGIFRTSNGGQTWVDITGSLAGKMILYLAASPVAPGTVYAASFGQGAFRSLDGGTTWSVIGAQLPSQNILHLSIAPDDPATIYVQVLLTGGSETQFFKSVDFGSSWLRQGANLPAGAFMSDLDFDPGDPSRLLAALGFYGIYRSGDAGASWTHVSSNPAWTTSIAFHPTNRGVIYAAILDPSINNHAGFSRSNDDGTTWSKWDTGLIASSINDIAVVPSLPTTVLAATDGRSVFTRIDCSTIPLSIVKAGSGAGQVSSQPAGIDCGGDCAEDVLEGTTVTLFAQADPGNLFIGWSGSGCTGTGICQIRAEGGPLAVTSTFVQRTFPLTVAVLGEGRVTSQPAGIDCGADCAEEIPEGTTVTLSAQADSGNLFVGWSGGGCTGTDSCQVLASSPRAVTATFAHRTFPLTVVVIGAGQVTSEPAGIDCGADCAENMQEGATLTLSAQADAGNLFAGWSGSGCTGTGPCQLVVSGQLAVTATFVRRTFPLTVAVTGVGRVTSQPAGIDCGTDCTENIPEGTTITLLAQADAGNLFASWSGGGCAGTGSCQLLVSGPLAVTATFVRQMFPLTVVVSGAGRVTSQPAGIDCGEDCAENIPEGTAVTLSAQADAGSLFAGWSGGCMGTGTCQVLANGPLAVAATFVRQVFPLTVIVTGAGWVTSQPAGIDCGLDCTESFAAGSFVTLATIPAPGFVFANWGGDVDCVDGQILINSLVSCTAVFVPQAPMEGGFYSLTPCRILDTRTTSDPLLASITRLIPIAGSCGVPESAQSVAVNVTVVQPSSGGWITLWQASSEYPGTYTNSFKAGDVRANNAVLPLDSGWLFARASLSGGGSVHLIIDVTGYFE